MRSEEAGELERAVGGYCLPSLQGRELFAKAPSVPPATRSELFTPFQPLISLERLFENLDKVHIRLLVVARKLRAPCFRSQVWGGFWRGVLHKAFSVARKFRA